MKLSKIAKEVMEEYCGTVPIDEVARPRYIIKIDGREYQVKKELFGLEIQTPDGWLHQQDFIDYLYHKEQTNALLDLAAVGLDRLLGIS